MLKNAITKGVLFATVLGATGGLASTTAFAADAVTGNQNVKANIIAGEFGAQINGNTATEGDVENGKVTATEVNFEDITIGQPIQSVTQDSMIKVLDRSGDKGWTLTAQNKNAASDSTLQLKIAITPKDEDDMTSKLSGETKLAEDAVTVATGKSRLNVNEASGTYSAEWGTKPKVGAYTNTIEWTLSPGVSEK